mmetsp:Transcript_9303/g.26143  ORF Transcript_9303/g.26143 Transcript_9303/m.26143 type:complete len:152 (+) Transcript_9303:96-551(+)
MPVVRTSQLNRHRNWQDQCNKSRGWQLKRSGTAPGTLGALGPVPPGAELAALAPKRTSGSSWMPARYGENPLEPSANLALPPVVEWYPRGQPHALNNSSTMVHGAVSGSWQLSGGIRTTSTSFFGGHSPFHSAPLARREPRSLSAPKIPFR